jgi:S1-C subfamily serine protease
MMQRATSTDEAAVCVVRSPRGTGLGFAFGGPRLVVTARHVIGEGGAEGPLRVEFGEGEDVARVVLAHPRVDIALLEMVGGAGASDWYRPGDAGSGPPFFVVTEQRRARRGGRRTILVRGVVSACQRTTRNRDGREEPLFIFPEPEGAVARSGAPLLAEDGSVLGVVTDAVELGGRRHIRAALVDALRRGALVASGGGPPIAAGLPR